MRVGTSPSEQTRNVHVGYKRKEGGTQALSYPVRTGTHACGPVGKRAPESNRVAGQPGKTRAKEARTRARPGARPLLSVHVPWFMHTCQLLLVLDRVVKLSVRERERVIHRGEKEKVRGMPFNHVITEGTVGNNSFSIRVGWEELIDHIFYHFIWKSSSFTGRHCQSSNLFVCFFFKNFIWCLNVEFLMHILIIWVMF